jgi:hypothetical protein
MVRALSQMHPCKIRVRLLISDVRFMLLSTLNLYSHIRSQSLTYLHKYCQTFPYLVYLPSILFVYLDIIGTLYNELHYPFDSLSHVLILCHSNERVILPPDKSTKHNVFTELAKLFSDMFLKG